MKNTYIINIIIKWNAILCTFLLLILIPSCSKKDEEQKPSDIWDIEKDGIPQFVEKNYIELEKIYRISKFRSSVGHDYSDAFEHCRSMKHYFEPRAGVDWSGIKIFSPVTGSITRAEGEWAGTKLEIASDDYPAFRFSIFHINTSTPFAVGDKVTAGQQLGTHTGMDTYSDISVIVNDPTRQGRMVSFFLVLKDQVFGEFVNRGISSRADLIISKELRDANPLVCNGDAFASQDPLEGWVVLE